MDVISSLLLNGDDAGSIFSWIKRGVGFWRELQLRPLSGCGFAAIKWWWVSMCVLLVALHRWRMAKAENRLRF